jgi:hypothetical protein
MKVHFEVELEFDLTTGRVNARQHGALVGGNPYD